MKTHYLLSLLLGFLSLTSFAAKDSMAHQLRTKARWHYAAALGGVFVRPPEALGTTHPAGFIGVATGLHYYREAQRLKSAHVLKNPTEYSEKEQRRAKKVIDQFYAKIEKKHKFTTLSKNQVTDVLADAYENGITFGLDENLPRLYEQPQAETLATVLFRDGKLEAYHQYVKTMRKAQHHAKARARVNKKVENGEDANDDNSGEDPSDSDSGEDIPEPMDDEGEEP